MFEGEHLPCTAHPALDLVEYQGNPELPGDPADGLQELHRCWHDPSLTLDGFEDDRGGFGDPALGVLEKSFEVVDAGSGTGLPSDPHGAAVGVGVGHELDAGHDVGDMVLGVAVPRERHGSVPHPVVASGEGYDGAPAGGGLAQLYGGIGGIGAGGGAELHLGTGCELLGEDGEQRVHELFFQRGGQVQAVKGDAGPDHVDHGLVDLVVVVSESEGSRPVQEVEVSVTLHILDP